MALRKGDPYDSTRAVVGIIFSVEVSLLISTVRLWLVGVAQGIATAGSWITGRSSVVQFLLVIIAVILVIGVFALIRGINFAIAQAIVNLLFRANKQPREESSTPSTTQKEIHNGNE